MVKRFIYILLFLSSSRIYSQDIWNLDRCINYALENNLSIQDQSVNIQIQKAYLNRYRLDRLPRLGSEINLNESFGRSIDPATNDYVNVNFFNNSYGISGSMVLFNGFSQSSRIAFQRYMLLAEKNFLEYQKDLLIYNVVDAYYLVILGQGLYRIASDNLELSRKQHINIQKMIQVGRKAESDLFEIQAKMASDSFLVIQQKGEYEKNFRALKSIMNFPVDKPLQIDSILVTVPAISDTISEIDLHRAASGNLYSLKVTESKLVAAKRQVQEARGKFSPNLMVYGGWSTNYTKAAQDPEPVSFRNQFKNHGGEYAGISLGLSLFDKFGKNSALKLAKLNYKKAEIAHQQEILKVGSEVTKAYIDWQTGKNEFNAAALQLTKARVSYDVAEKKLLLGQLNVIEYDIQKNELLRSRTEVLRTKLQLLLREKYVSYLLTGKWITTE